MEKLIIILIIGLIILSGCTEAEIVDLTSNLTYTSLDIANKTMVWADQQNNRLDCAFAGIPITECD